MVIEPEITDVANAIAEIADTLIDRATRSAAGPVTMGFRHNPEYTEDANGFRDLFACFLLRLSATETYNADRFRSFDYTVGKRQSTS